MLRLLTLFSCLFISMFSFAEEKQALAEAEIIQVLTELRKQIPQQYLSLDAVAEYNEYDENKIIEWLSKNIQYTPSPGYQLTPERTLQTATGNALEQAILLQNILIQAGFEARIAKTELDETTATSLLKQSFNSSPSKNWDLDEKIYNKYLKNLSDTLKQPQNSLFDKFKELNALTPWRESKLFKDSELLAKIFSNAIAQENAWQTSDSMLKPWIEIAKDYYFVKYRLAQGDKWLQVHPAFVESPPVIEKSSYYTDDISSQHHQITLQAFITRKTDQKTETIAVIPPIERSSLELFEHQLTYETVPSKFQEAMNENALELTYESEFFIPTINGVLIENTRVFGLDGEDYAAKDILGSSQQFVKMNKKNITSTTSTLDKLAKPKDEINNPKVKPSILLDYYFKISWKSPNGDSRELRRTIYQRNDKEIQKENKKLAIHNISQRVLLAAEPAVLTPAAQFSEQLKTQISIFEYSKNAKSLNYSTPQIISKLNQMYDNQKDFRFNNTLELSLQNENKERYFSAPPMIAMIWELKTFDNNQLNGTTTFDYLINAAQVVKLSDSQLEMDLSATVSHGVWSTFSEALVQAKQQEPGKQLSRRKLPDNVVSAAGQFNQASMDGSVYTTVKNTHQLEKYTHLNELGKRILTEDLNNNPHYLYLLPVKRPQSDFLAYYRVDTQTGETLGYSESGRGEASYIIQAKLFMNLVAGAYGLGKCLGGEKKGMAAVGCTMCTLISTTAGMIASVGKATESVISVVAGGTGAIACDAVF